MAEARVTAAFLEVAEALSAYTATVSDGVVMTDTLSQRIDEIVEILLTLTETTPIVGIYDRALSDDLEATDTVVSVNRFTPEVTDGVDVTPIDDTLTMRFALVTELLALIGTVDIAAIYGMTASADVQFVDRTLVGWSQVQTESLTTTDMVVATDAPTVRETVTLDDAEDVLGVYGAEVAQVLSMLDAAAPVAGASLADAVTLTDALAYLYRGDSVLLDTLVVTDDLTQQLVMRVVAADMITLTATDAIRLLYDALVAEQVQLQPRLVSPDGTITTWAMTTSTGGVTEYTHYAYNSFARMGRRYLAASETGLYTLDGETDNGADIIARLKTGFLQFGGSRFSAFKAIYLGMRANGSMVLKLTTGTDAEYVYNVVIQNQQTTRVHLGKGLRARYFAFELVTTGQDFDLDTIEFLPLVAQRRV